MECLLQLSRLARPMYKPMSWCRTRMNRITYGKLPWLAATYKQRVDALRNEFREDRPPLHNGGIALEDVRQFVQQASGSGPDERETFDDYSDITAEAIDGAMSSKHRLNMILQSAYHYDIFRHTFGNTMFYPIVPLNVLFADPDSEFGDPVYQGNLIIAEAAKSAPSVAFVDAGCESGLHTLVFTALDEDYVGEQTEIVHWIVANVPAGDVEKGDCVTQYLQPLPARGVGYHRYAFILFRQSDRIHVSKFSTASDADHPFKSRLFSTSNFRRSLDGLTPVGLCFFQSVWDPSVREQLHKMDLPDPCYEHNRPQDTVHPQKAFPRPGSKFNEYLDRYRDRKEISEEVMKEYLAELDPLRPPPSEFNPYPIDKPLPKIETWRKRDYTQKMLREGKWQNVGRID